MWRAYVVVRGREQGFRLIYDTEERARAAVAGVGGKGRDAIEINDDHGVTVILWRDEIAAVLLSHLEEEVAAEAEEIAIREAGKAKAILRVNEDPDVRRARLAMAPQQGQIVVPPTRFS